MDVKNSLQAEAFTPLQTQVSSGRGLRRFSTEGKKKKEKICSCSLSRFLRFHHQLCHSCLQCLDVLLLSPWLRGFAVQSEPK